ncbi:T9SS type A sorting domain-containing protein [Flavobacterium sp. Root186]|uniref:T9SS type A sorting domain-containing protein n=1 Tax=Flavobacterium sp. Root186 TaxID=1736485 RepID=UPI003516915A
MNKVQVYSALGQLLLDNDYNADNVKIDFTPLSPDLYFVKIYSEDKFTIIKTIKK